MISIPIATKVRAYQLARKLVKDQIRRKGHKPSSFSHAELMRLAQMYVNDNPQIVEQARQEVTAWVKAGLMGKKAQKAALAAQEATTQLG